MWVVLASVKVSIRGGAFYHLLICFRWLCMKIWGNAITGCLEVRFGVLGIDVF